MNSLRNEPIFKSWGLSVCVGATAQHNSGVTVKRGAFLLLPPLPARPLPPATRHLIPYSPVVLHRGSRERRAFCVVSVVSDAGPLAVFCRLFVLSPTSSLPFSRVCPPPIHLAGMLNAMGAPTNGGSTFIRSN